ncbi:hypothetical protein K7X08_033875 [Anisodus acutangulus]|uniref:RRM domain-containing protein n=1 Tax=Anisodus acutangulus TaxID=402998 RepID=A0A9Q1M2W8_9SOLA|nr:hypothetical protein K7X08_033875 [Anisodus acutangulus]
MFFLVGWHGRHSDSLRGYFEQFCDIVEAVVITDKLTGCSKVYGFVTYRDPEAARRACANPNPIIDGRRANCNLAALGRRFLPYGFIFSLPYCVIFLVYLLYCHIEPDCK